MYWQYSGLLQVLRKKRRNPLKRGSKSKGCPSPDVDVAR